MGHHIGPDHNREGDVGGDGGLAHVKDGARDASMDRWLLDLPLFLLQIQVQIFFLRKSV